VALVRPSTLRSWVTASEYLHNSACLRLGENIPKADHGSMNADDSVGMTVVEDNPDVAGASQGADGSGQAIGAHIPGSYCWRRIVTLSHLVHRIGWLDYPRLLMKGRGATL
jgi:hypothetical protein